MMSTRKCVNHVYRSCVTYVVFNNRQEAGILLAQKLSSHVDRSSIVIGIARGGVVVAAAVSDKLSLPLSVVVIKKIPSPTNSELAIGAVAPEGVTFVDWDLAEEVGADKNYIASQRKILRALLQKRQTVYSQGGVFPLLQGRTVVLVDDGIATGATAKAAVLWLRKKNVGTIVIATPIVALDTDVSLRALVDEFIALDVQEQFSSVGQFYRQFEQVDDSQVVALLKKRQ